MTDMQDKPSLLMIVGPTASGKTAVSIGVAERLAAEILSADSIQVYRGFTIGSAKPSRAEMGNIRHHLIDIVDPETLDFSVAEYARLARECVDGILARGHIPLVVGGTGLYVNAFTHALDFTPAPPNAQLRAELQAIEAAERGALYQRLAASDPAAAARLHPNDHKRIIRALEVYLSTGQPMSSYGAGFTAGPDGGAYRVTMAGLTMPRELLYERIERRVDGMIAAGLLDEVKALIDSGVPKQSPAMQGLGYRQLAAYIEGACSLDKAIDAIKRETRRFAKRQLTWFRRESRIQWFDITSYASDDALADAIAAYFKESHEVSHEQ